MLELYYLPSLPQWTRILQARTPPPQQCPMLTIASRQGISIFDYLNKPEISERFNAVRHQVRLQAGYIQQDVPELPQLAARWVEFFDDFVQTRQREAQSWLQQAVFEALEPWLQAYDNNEVDLFQYGMVVTTLDGFLEMIDNMLFPADTQPSMQNPDPNNGF